MAYNQGRRSGGRGGGGYRGGGGGGYRSGGFRPREMHKATCAECGKECEVPFKPSGDRPVYCKECYLKRKGIEPRQQRVEEKPAEVKEESENF